MVNQTNNFFQEEAAMSKISVVYWSQTGNTQAMAEAVGAGIHHCGTGGYPGGIDDADRGGKNRGDEADLCR